MRKFLSVIGAISGLAWPVISHARNEIHAGAHAQLLAFGTGEPEGGFVLLSVPTAGDTTADPTKPEIPRLAAASLLAGLETDSTSGNIARLDGASGAAGLVNLPLLAVPAWMRRGHPAMPGQAFNSDRQLVAGCGAEPSQGPSGLMAPQGEERRKLLYPMVVAAACRHGIPVGLLDAMIIQESRYNPLAFSAKGAFGLGQLMPGTAAMLGVNRFDPRANLDGSARYLAAHLREFRDPGLALAAYNAGPGRVRKNWQVPGIPETQDYVRKILWNWRNLEWNARARMPVPPSAF